MDKIKKKYTAPGLTVVSFRTERGFAESGVYVFNGWAAGINDQLGQEIEMINVDGARTSQERDQLTAANFDANGGIFGGTGWNEDPVDAYDYWF